MQKIGRDHYLDDVEDAEARFLAEPRKSAVSLAHANGESTVASILNTIMLYLSWTIVTLIPLFWFGCFWTIRDYERAIVFRFGKIIGNGKTASMGPGLVIVNPLCDVVKVVDLRVKTLNLIPQSMMTRDSVTCVVDGIVYTQVTDVLRSVLEVEHVVKATELFAATSLRSVVGSHDLQDLLTERTKINRMLKDLIQEETDRWGVTVTNVEVKDITLPTNMQRAMASEAETERERRSKVISSLGELEASDNLRKAAKTIASQPAALQLRYLDTLKNISQEHNSTVLFPFPMEMMKGFQVMTSLSQQRLDEERARQI